MASLQYFSTPGKGEYARDNFHFSEAVVVGDRIELAGQTGADPTDRTSVPPNLLDEISQAFTNVNNVLCHTLHALNPSDPKPTNGWSHVFRLRTYHTNLKETRNEVLGPTVQEVRKWCGPNHKPIWTLIGVERLSSESYHVEVEVEAFVGDLKK